MFFLFKWRTVKLREIVGQANVFVAYWPMAQHFLEMKTEFIYHNHPQPLFTSQFRCCFPIFQCQITLVQRLGREFIPTLIW